jgi:hypothetical protein
MPPGRDFIFLSVALLQLLLDPGNVSLREIQGGFPRTATRYGDSS